MTSPGLTSFTALLDAFWVVLSLCFLLGHPAKPLASRPPRPSLLCMDLTLDADVTLKTAVCEQAGDKNTRTFLSVFEIPALESTWQFIALFHQLLVVFFFFFLEMSQTETLPDQARATVGDFPRVCAGASSS